VGEFKGELGELKVWVNIDKKKGTLTISDRGIGMTAEEIDKTSIRLHFRVLRNSSKNTKTIAQAIIGHFGLGFYSSFMVSKKK
jgi:molecular chaperone HtpG